MMTTLMTKKKSEISNYLIILVDFDNLRCQKEWIKQLEPSSESSNYFVDFCEERTNW